MSRLFFILALSNLTGCVTYRLAVDKSLTQHSEVHKVREQPAWYAFWTKDPWKYGSFTLTNVSVNEYMGVGLSMRTAVASVGGELKGHEINFTSKYKNISVDSRCIVGEKIMTVGSIIRKNDVEITCSFDTGPEVWQMLLTGAPETLEGDLKQSGEVLHIAPEHQDKKLGKLVTTLGYSVTAKKKVLGVADLTGEPDFIVEKGLAPKRKALLGAIAGAFFIAKRYTHIY